jgi:hypothetical protein
MLAPSSPHPVSQDSFGSLLLTIYSSLLLLPQAVSYCSQKVLSGLEPRYTIIVGNLVKGGRREVMRNSGVL